MTLVAFPDVNRLQPGAVVVLRSGGANMIVEKVEGVDIQCIWINNEHSIGREKFKRYTLNVIADVPKQEKNLRWSNYEAGEKP